MIVTNILNRVLRIRSSKSGTGLVADYRGKAFIFTATHVVPEIRRGSKLNVDATRLSAELTVLRKESRADAYVIEVEERLDTTGSECDLGGDFHFGEDVYLFGFPAGQGRHVDVLADDPNRPKIRHMMPFVRKGIISNVEQREFVVDTLIQKGFSGGPVVKCRTAATIPGIVGIVSSGLLFDQDRALLDDDRGVTIRSGFTSCLMIQSFKEIVEDLF